jgi:hypothetical protein
MIVGATLYEFSILLITLLIGIVLKSKANDLLLSAVCGR